MEIKENFQIAQASGPVEKKIADMIRRAYKTVADTFNLTPDNCPKHPSNCTKDWIQADINRGVQYYLATINNQPAGCVALEYPDPNPDRVVYLERLCVLPEFRHQGLGEKLVDYGIEQAKAFDAEKIGIGIIDEQNILKQWYIRLGFQVTGTKRFDHLPFTVGFMEKSLQ